MITVVLRGGLGNQMFEYAAGLNRALEKKTKLVVDTTFLNDRFPRRQFTYRTYDLDVFTITPEFTALSKMSTAVPIPGVWLGVDLAMMMAKKIVRPETTLWGFYQSENYFAAHQDAIRAAFHFRNPLDGEATKMAKQIATENSVSLHVRRGDYTLSNNVKLFGTTNVEYYDRAIASIVEQVANPHFFIFSDDMAWTREHIKPQFPTTYLDDATRGPKASFHLQLMSLCRHNIIANSSFSWWGAWLNRNPEKIVIAPAHWHADPVKNREVVPDNWIRL